MPIFSSGMPRLAAVLFALAGFIIVSPVALALGPDLCVWRHLFHLSACPSCGSTRALAAFFHGQFAAALAFNRNVVITAPGLLALAARDGWQLLKKF